MNDGDWVESCSALVEHVDGRWEILFYERIENEETNNDCNSQ